MGVDLMDHGVSTGTLGVAASKSPLPLSGSRQGLVLCSIVHHRAKV